MAIASVVLLSNVTLPIGTTSFGPVTPPLGMSKIQVAIDRTLLTSVTLVVSWAIELSRDSGLTWVSWGGGGTIGGVLVDNLLNPITESSFTVNFGSPTDPATQVRGTITSNEVVVTSVTARIS